MNQKKILIIDDDVQLTQMLSRYLERYNYKMAQAANTTEGFKKFTEFKPDAILLDVTMPGESGLQLCRKVRENSSVPIIIISALGETSDRIVGLEIGADDYLPKPFDSRELVARLEALFRRQEKTGKEDKLTVSLGGLDVDEGKRSAMLDGAPLELSSAEFALLLVFVRKPGQVFSRDELLNELRGIDWEAYNRSVDVLISRLRRKLNDDPKNPRFLKTVWGTGYTFLSQGNLRKAG